MSRMSRQAKSTWKASVARVAATAFALGGLAAVGLAPGIAAAAGSPSTASEISTVKDAKLGTILIADDTVYTLKPSKTACTSACLKVWRPVMLPQGVMTPSAGTGVDASKLGTKAASDGSLQVTYSGKPLYWFAKDTAPGQVHGNVSDKWGKWSTVQTAKASSGSNTNAGTGGTAF